ncbi:MAG: hypothetical protein MJZ95_00395 [Paludibacteraceae bacterium]|nr:hypothetical protein [Paludibacteraceae bacterium]
MERSFWSWVRRRLFSKETATYCVFLLIAAVLWLMYTIGSQREIERTVAVTYWGIPDDVYLNGKLPDQITFTVRDEGNELSSFLFAEFDTIEIDLSAQFRHKNSRKKEIRIDYKPYVEELVIPISSTSTVTNVNPSTITYTYGHVYTRRVPVRFSVEPVVDPQYALLREIRITPNEVLIRGERKAIDSVKCIYVDSLPGMLCRNEVIECALLKPNSAVELLTKRVSIDVAVERVTEKNFRLPIEVVGVDGIRVKLFPETANVIFAVGLSRYYDVDAKDFRVVFDYSTRDEERKTVRLNLQTNSDLDGIRYKIEPEEVEYITEQ